jgi:hypothetical protein
VPTDVPLFFKSKIAIKEAIKVRISMTVVDTSTDQFLIYLEVHVLDCVALSSVEGAIKERDVFRAGGGGARAKMTRYIADEMLNDGGLYTTDSTPR